MFSTLRLILGPPEMTSQEVHLILVLPHHLPHLSFIRGALPKYFHSEWLIAQFRSIEAKPYIVAFGYQKNTVVILGMDGRHQNQIQANFHSVSSYTRTDS